MIRIIRFTLVILIALALAPAAAMAEKRIAVATFRGDTKAASNLERDVRRLVEAEHRVVSRKSDKVDGVVYGTVTRRKANYYLFHILVVDKGTGKRFDEIVLTLDKPRLDGEARSEAKKELRARLRKVSQSSDSGKTKNKPKDKPKNKPKDKPRRPPPRDDEDEDTDVLEEEDGDENEEELEEEDELEEEEDDEEGDDDEEVLIEETAGDDALLDEERLEGDDDDGEESDIFDDDDDFGSESIQAGRSRFADMPMELIAGANVFERTFADNGDTGVASYIARGDFYPLTRRKGLIRYLGVVFDASRAAVAPAPVMGMAVASIPTDFVMGATARHRFQRGHFVFLSKMDAGVNFTVGGGAQDLSPIVRGQYAAGAAVQNFYFLAEVANFRATGDSARDSFNALPNLVVDWRLRQNGIHPFAIAVVPLRKADRDAAAPLILQVGMRYEQ